MIHNHSPFGPSSDCAICKVLVAERNRQLAELSRVISGRSSVRDLVYSSVKVKAGSSSRLHQSKRMVMHPEKQRLNQERVRNLTELSRFIRG